MRYLLLSVLVVCVIGVMVPIVLAESKIPTILILDPVDLPTLSTVTFSGTLKTVGGSPVGDSIRFSSQIYIQGNIIDDGVIIDVIEVGNTGTNTEGKFFYKWTGGQYFGNSVFDEFPQEKELTISFFAEYRGSQTFEPSTSQVHTVQFINPLFHYPFTSGVKNPGPLFKQDSGLSVIRLYENITTSDFYWFNWFGNSERGFNVSNAKIVRGDEKDLLVFNLLIENKMNTPDDTIRLDEVIMYDGKDRKFTPIVSDYVHSKNTAFDWNEYCPDNPFMEIQPGIKGKMKVCYEIPKNADHFKVVSAGQLALVFDKISLGIGTMDSEPESPIQQTQQQALDSKGGGCLIATAAFGSEMAPQVQFLRELRDNTVLQTESGTSFMTGFNQFYYSFSPAIADYERENPAFKEAVKITLTPLLASLTLLQYTDIDTESEMLGYGIGVILLNIGMYFVAPAVVIMAVRKRI